MRLSVPGNILLLGEYAVLEEGGLGLALAVEPRVRVQTRPAAGLCIDGTWPGGSVRWTGGETSRSPLLAASVAMVQEWLAGHGFPAVVDRHIRIDSSDFFRADGKKSGLGSSAAVAVGLVCALLDAAGVPARDRDAAATTLAIAAHRAAQGGTGSGYDVTCSFHGGAGLFRGGRSPSWEPRQLPFAARVLLFHGTAPVTTAGAVSLYYAWKQRCPEDARLFVEESNRKVTGFLEAGSARAAREALGECRRLGIRLGEAIGVPAGMNPPRGLEPLACKAVGAGNELGVCLALSGETGPHTEKGDAAGHADDEADAGSVAAAAAEPGAQRVVLSERGVVWEE